MGQWPHDEEAVLHRAGLTPHVIAVAFSAVSVTEADVGIDFFDLALTRPRAEIVAFKPWALAKWLLNNLLLKVEC